MPPRPTLRALGAALLHPAIPEERAAVARSAERLPGPTRSGPQPLGTWTAGCAATRGVHEACDLACTACYRSPEAQATPPLPQAEVERQLDAIRAHLGPGGHVQLTAGEVTLLPPERLLALVRAARARSLVPMLMTNGVRLLAEPELLERLVVEGGLRHLAVHIDSTQRGRAGWREGQPESDWHPERERVAQLVRGIRARTGVSLRVAHTLTVTEQNLPDVSDVLGFALARSDAFFMVSLQPAAAVGTTRARDLQAGAAAATCATPARARPATSSSSPDDDPVWQAVQRAVGLPLERRAWLFGHSDCSQVALLLAVRAGARTRYLPFVRPGSRVDAYVARRLLTGGLAGWTPHSEHRALSGARLVGRLLRDPALLLELPLWIGLRSLGAAPVLLRAGLARLAGRPAWLRGFSVVVHRFMDAAQLETPRGRERLAACAFRVPVGDEMVSMCELNATDLRRQLDSRDRQRARRHDLAATPAPTSSAEASHAEAAPAPRRIPEPAAQP